MSNMIIDIQKLYERGFGTRPYHVEKVKNDQNGGEVYKVLGATPGKLSSDYLTKDSKGVEIWLPIHLTDLPVEIGDRGCLFLPYAVISISGSSTYVRTPLAERKGTAKELYSEDDYKITIKGFFIDKESRVFPEKDLQALKKIKESGTAFKIENVLTDIFLTDKSLPAIEQNRVVLSSFNLPEVEGGRRARPFVMQLESDCVFTLEVE